MMAVAKVTGMPIIEGLKSADDMPHPISYAIMYRTRIDSFRELPKDKQPPRDLWNKPHKLEEFFDEVFETKGAKKKMEYIDLSLDDAE